MGVYPIVWEEWITWKKRFLLYLGSYMMSPLLFLITFGWGSGNPDYLYFLLPGIMAFSSLLNCYNGVLTRIISAKTLLHTMDFYFLAPIERSTLIFGYMVAGALRGFFAICLILVVGFLLQIQLVLSLPFFIILFLLCAMFSILGVAIGFWAETFKDTYWISDLFILPMSFLGGTFVAVEKLPVFLQSLAWFLPLTPGATLLRSLAHGQGMIWSCLGMLLLWCLLFFYLADISLKRAMTE